MKVPAVDGSIVNSYKRTLNSAILIWVAGRASAPAVSRGRRWPFARLVVAASWLVGAGVWAAVRLG